MRRWPFSLGGTVQRVTSVRSSELQPFSRGDGCRPSFGVTVHRTTLAAATLAMTISTLSVPAAAAWASEGPLAPKTYASEPLQSNVTPSPYADEKSDGFKDCSQRCVSAVVVNHGDNAMILTDQKTRREYLSHPAPFIEEGNLDSWTVPSSANGQTTAYALTSGRQAFRVYFGTTLDGDGSAKPQCFFTNGQDMQPVTPENLTCRAESGENPINPLVVNTYYSVNSR